MGGAALAIYGLELPESLYRASRHGAFSDFGANPGWLLTGWLNRNAPDRLASGGIVEIVNASRPALRAFTLVNLIAYGVMLRKYWKSTEPNVEAWVLFSLAGYLTYFLFSAGVHENHLFLANLQ